MVNGNEMNLSIRLVVIRTCDLACSYRMEIGANNVKLTKDYFLSVN